MFIILMQVKLLYYIFKYIIAKEEVIIVYFEKKLVAR